MEKSKLAIAADELMRAAAIWLFSAICVRYVIKELYLIVLVATAITMLSTLLIRRYYDKKNLSAKKIQRTDDVMNELTVLDRADLLNSIKNAVNGTIENDCIICSNTVIYPYFYGKLPLEKLNYAYNTALKKNKKLLVLCAESSPEVDKKLHLFSTIKVAVLQKKQTFELLDSYNILPQTINRTKKKISLRKTALRKSKIKGYLVAALVLLVSASFSPYALLCIICAAVNITLSILCELKGY